MEITTIVVSAVIGAVVAFVGAYSQGLLEARSGVSQAIRSERQTLYRQLWNHTGLLPLWPRDHTVTYQDVHELTLTLKRWYFERGGIYLSTDARNSYGVAQKRMCEIVNLHRHELSDNLTSGDYDDIRERLSGLRTNITLDLSSRKRPPFGT